MNLQKHGAQIILGILVALVLLSSIAIIAPDKTAFVTAVPSTCKAKVEIDAPSSIDMYAGTTGETSVKVTALTCGISFVRLGLAGISKDYYTTNPTYYRVMPPGTSNEFKVLFDIPEGTEHISYTGTYMLYTNEGRYTFEDFSLNVVELEKPKIEVAPVPSVAKEELVIERKPVITYWHLIGIFSAILAIIVISVEYFTHSFQKARKDAFKRAESGIGTVFGESPSKEEEFEAVLRKGRKKR